VTPRYCELRDRGPRRLFLDAAEAPAGPAGVAPLAAAAGGGAAADRRSQPPRGPAAAAGAVARKN